jgi:hypothetical protein
MEISNLKSFLSSELDTTCGEFKSFGLKYDLSVAKFYKALIKDAYSHDCISFGFWFGDDNIPEPVFYFYSYTYPSLKALREEQLALEEALWIDSNDSPMAVLKYKDIRTLQDPRASLLMFLESAYQAGAKLTN